MLSTLRCAALRLARRSMAFPISTTTATRYSDTNPPTPEIIDIDAEQHMYEDEDGHGNEGMLAPTDIDAFADEDEKHGTVEIDAGVAPEPEYPPIPKHRSGIYEFKGITIMMPQSMLQNPATYRWRMDPEDHSTPDDTRICKFEPKETKAEEEK